MSTVLKTYTIHIELSLNCLITTLKKEEDGEPHLNYYHQRNTMAAIRTFNKMITKRLLGEDTTSSDGSDRFRMIKFEADVTEESGPVTVAPADDEGGFTQMGFLHTC